MISLERCREILGPDCQLSDEELERLRDQLYTLADIITTAFLENRERGLAAPENAPDEAQTGKKGFHEAARE